jgi:hypothetical protein
MENVPRTPHSAVARPLRDHSTLERQFHQSFPQVFLCLDPCGVYAPIRQAETSALRLLRLAEPREELAVRGEFVLALGSDTSRRVRAGGRLS